MIRFKKLREEHLEQVLDWRTQEDVTRFMNTDIEKNLEKQQDWFTKVSVSSTDKYWVIEMKNQPVGLIYLSDIDPVNRRTSWGFYIGEEDYRLYGGIVPLYLYNFVFLKLGFHKITAEVMSGNENVIMLNKMHGCREVGTFKEHIFKKGVFHDLVVMELLKDEWLTFTKYQKYISEFEE